MTTSSSKNFEIDVVEYIEEAFERCGLEVRTGYDLKTAKRSMNLLFADWANRGLNQWTIDQTSITVASGVSEYPAGTLTLSVALLSKFLGGGDNHRRHERSYGKHNEQTLDYVCRHHHTSWQFSNTRNNHWWYKRSHHDRLCRTRSE